MKKQLLILLMLISISISAQQIETDRPDQTETATTIQANAFQFEAGIQQNYIGENPKEVINELIAPGILLRYGLTDFIELRLAHESFRSKDQFLNNKGINNWELGFKLQILNKDDINTQIAFLSHLIVPNGSHIKSDKYSLVNKLSLSHELSEILSLGYNLGVNMIDFESYDLTYSIALGISINDEVGIYIEPFGQWIKMETLEANFDTGVTYLLNDNFQFDFAIGTGINHKMNYLAIGCSWLVQPW